MNEKTNSTNDAWRFHDEGITIGAGTRARTIPWNEIRGVYWPLFGTRPALRTNAGAGIPLPLKPEAQRDSLIEFFQEWAKKAPRLARKNAFDYCEPPQAGAWLIIAISVFLCYLLGGTLIQETMTQRACSEAFKESAIVQTAEVLKKKKRQQGNFNVTVRFQATNGEVIEGRRHTLKKFAIGEPDPAQFSVIYAESRPSCWALSETFGQNDLNWAKRRYTASFNALVALSFLIVGTLGIGVSILRLRQKRPFREDVARAMSLPA